MIAFSIAAGWVRVLAKPLPYKYAVAGVPDFGPVSLVGETDREHETLSVCRVTDKSYNVAVLRLF
jgi:hypothetical protein